MSPAEIVKGVRASDPEALAYFYKRLRKYRGGQDWEDRIHDVYLIVVRQIQRGKLNHPGSLWKFVATIRWRVKWAEHERAERTAPYFAHRSLPVDYLEAERAEIVRGQVAKLRPKQRTVIERHYLNGERLREIAADLGVCPQNITQHKYNGLSRLRFAMRQYTRPARCGNRLLIPLNL